MNLHIRNFAKISDVNLRLDGITVIAGDNNTGKSTTGKVLYSVFRGLSNIDRRIVKERTRTVKNVFNAIPGADLPDDIANSLLDGTLPAEVVLLQRASQWCRTYNVPNCEVAAQGMVNNALPDVLRKLSSIRSATADSIGSVILLRVFNCVFHGQYHPLKPTDGMASVEYTIKDNGRDVDNWIHFHHDHVEINSPVSLKKTVRLISDPNALNLLNVRDFATNRSYATLLDKFVYELGEELCKPDTRTAVESALSREGLRNAFDHLSSVISDSVHSDEKNSFVLREPGNTDETRVENLSMGMKSLVLLKTILERQILGEKDILILDEPEIHLHPEWQVFYAKLIVLLRQAYDLTILLTSHSPVFVNAIQRYANEAGLDGTTNFYLSKEDASHPGFCTVDHLEANTGPIYRGFNKSRSMLERLSEYPEMAELR